MRFLKHGRYVPPEVIAIKGNRINRNVLRTRKEVDSYIIVDTDVYKKPVVVYKSEKDLRHNFRDP